MLRDEFLELEPLYPKATEFAKSEATMSISKMQRQFQIGYNRAARIVERLADDKVLTFDRMTGAYSRAPSANPQA